MRPRATSDGEAPSRGASPVRFRSPRLARIRGTPARLARPGRRVPRRLRAAIGTRSSRPTDGPPDRDGCRRRDATLRDHGRVDLPRSAPGPVLQRDHGRNLPGRPRAAGGPDVEGRMASSWLSLPRSGPIAGLSAGGIGTGTISRIEIGTGEVGSRGHSEGVLSSPSSVGVRNRECPHRRIVAGLTQSAGRSRTTPSARPRRTRPR
jgi:hypothetical protein